MTERRCIECETEIMLLLWIGIIKEIHVSGPVVVVRGQQVRAAVLGRLDREGQESRGFQDRKEDLVFREIQDPAAIQVNKDQQALKVFQVLLGTQVLPVLKDQWGRKVRKEFLEILACQGQRDLPALRGRKA